MKIVRNFLMAAVFVVAALFVTSERVEAWSSCEAWAQTCEVAGGHLVISYSWCEQPEEIHRAWCIRDYDGAQLGVRSCSYRGEEWCAGENPACSEQIPNQECV